MWLNADWVVIMYSIIEFASFVTCSYDVQIYRGWIKTMTLNHL